MAPVMTPGSDSGSCVLSVEKPRPRGVGRRCSVGRAGHLGLLAA